MSVRTVYIRIEDTAQCKRYPGPSVLVRFGKVETWRSEPVMYAAKSFSGRQQVMSTGWMSMPVQPLSSRMYWARPAACPAPSHRECPTFRRLLRAAPRARWLDPRRIRAAPGAPVPPSPQLHPGTSISRMPLLYEDASRVSDNRRMRPGRRSAR